MATTLYIFNRTFPTPINATTAADQRNFDLVSLGNGDSFVLYGTYQSATLYPRIIGPDGKPVSGEKQFATNASPGAQAAVLTNGDVVITWADTATENVDYQVYNRNLNPVTTVLSLPPHKYLSDSPDVAALRNGNFAIVYHLVVSSTQDDIYYQTLTTKGAPIQDPIPVDVSANISEFPLVAGLTNGNIAIAYDRQGGNRSTMLRAVFDSTGNTVTAASPIGGGGPGIFSDQADVVALPNGGFTVNYSDNSYTGTTRNITTAAFNARGVRLGNAQDSFFPFFPGNDLMPKAAVSVDGYQLVAFTHQTPEMSDLLRARCSRPVDRRCLP